MKSFLFLKSLRYALIGLRLAWERGQNFRIQVFIAFAVLLFGGFLHISPLELAVVVFAITLVICAEAFNTALEELCDKFQPTHDPHIARIKDLSAAAVLLTAIGAAIIGTLVFLPHILQW
jgi:diacylglycerol kinase